MEITQEELDRLSFQERTVLFLTNAAYNVLQYARAEYVQAKVDVAFAAEDGLTVYSYAQGHEVIRYLVRPDGTPVPADGLGPEEVGPESLFADAGKEDVNRVFRKWEEEESETPVKMPVPEEKDESVKPGTEADIQEKTGLREHRRRGEIRKSFLTRDQEEEIPDPDKPDAQDATASGQPQGDRE